MSLLRGSVSAGESGPLITLSGETDLTTVAELSELVTGQLAGGTRHLTIDASGLSFADSASVRVLLLAARTLREHGGCLVLLRPQGALARVLEIMGADQMITVRGEIERAPAPEATAGLSPESGVHGLFATRRGPGDASAQEARSPGHNAPTTSRAVSSSGQNDERPRPGECDGEGQAEDQAREARRTSTTQSRPRAGQGQESQPSLRVLALSFGLVGSASAATTRPAAPAAGKHHRQPPLRS